MNQVDRDDSSADQAGHMTLDHPDRALLLACANFDALERQGIAATEGVPEDTPEWDTAEAARWRRWEKQEQFVELMVGSRAVTAEGAAARAKSFLLWDGGVLSNEGDVGKRLLRAILRDITGPFAKT